MILNRIVKRRGIINSDLGKLRHQQLLKEAGESIARVKDEVAPS